jgi:peptidoglycan/xylan/chitin deacetylase (PgdA/CDA1 family)
MPIVNAMTIDVEDWFQVSAMAPYIARKDWDACDCRVEANVERLLGLLQRHDTRATFFTLGWVAERYPHLVRRIVEQGHELASHGYGHQRASELTPVQLREDLIRAKGLLEDLGGVPVTTVRVGSRNLPSSGGGWFRLFPYALTQWMIRRVNREDAQPAIFYFHPWEIDHGQPRVPGIDRKTRFRHYVNIARTERRLDALLRDFRWGRMDDIFLGQSARLRRD